MIYFQHFLRIKSFKLWKLKFAITSLGFRDIMVLEDMKKNDECTVVRAVACNEVLIHLVVTASGIDDWVKLLSKSLHLRIRIEFDMALFFPSGCRDP